MAAVVRLRDWVVGHELPYSQQERIEKTALEIDAFADMEGADVARLVAREEVVALLIDPIHLRSELVAKPLDNATVARTWLSLMDGCARAAAALSTIGALPAFAVAADDLPRAASVVAALQHDGEQAIAALAPALTEAAQQSVDAHALARTRRQADVLRGLREERARGSERQARPTGKTSTVRERLRTGPWPGVRMLRVLAEPLPSGAMRDTIDQWASSLEHEYASLATG